MKSWPKVKSGLLGKMKGYIMTSYTYALVYEVQGTGDSMTLIWPCNVSQGQMFWGKLKQYMIYNMCFTNFDHKMLHLWGTTFGKLCDLYLTFKCHLICHNYMTSYIYMFLINFVIVPRRLSITFSFHTVTRTRMSIARNFAGICTMSWGCAV